MKKLSSLILTLILSAPLFSSQIIADVPAAGEPGPWGVGRTFVQLFDDSRAGHSLAPGNTRYIPVEVWYPVAPANITGAGTTYGLFPNRDLPVGPAGFAEDEAVPANGNFPFLVFSHGFEAVSLQSTELMEIVASHGFIVVAPEHQGNSQFMPSENGYSPLDAARDRVLDVSFLIDYFTTMAPLPNGLTTEHIDADNIGVFGHSYGGSTTMGSVTGWGGSPGDPRVKAIVPISGVFRDDESLGDGFFSDSALRGVSVPVLLIGGTRDDLVTIEENNDRAFKLLPARNNIYQLDVMDAAHGSFGSICAIANTFVNFPGLTVDPELDLAAQVLPQLDLFLVNFGLDKAAVESLIGVPLDPMIVLLSQQYDETCRPPILDNAEVVRLTALYTVSFFKRFLDYDQGFRENLNFAAQQDADVMLKQKVYQAPEPGTGSIPWLWLPLLAILIYRRRQ